MTRGTVLPLTALERRNRMLYLAGELTLSKLTHVRKDPANLIALGGYATDDGEIVTPTRCPTFYYLLKDHNGGKDPTAPDPATRWRKPKTVENPKPNLNRTSDCIGGMSWCGGFDRYQPARFNHLYGGWINTDSMSMDAVGKAKCFRKLDRPELGCFVVFRSGAGGHKVGHIGGIVSLPAEYAPEHREWWMELGVVDVAARVGRANKRGNGLTWFKKNALFIVPTMVP